MIAGKPTRTVVKTLKAAGWSSLRTKGSHSRWVCASGRHKVTVPDGHPQISFGVLKQITAALDECDCTKE